MYQHHWADIVTCDMQIDSYLRNITSPRRYDDSQEGQDYSVLLVTAVDRNNNGH